MFSIIVLLLFVLGITIRFIPRYVYPMAIVSDTFFHLQVAKEILDNNFRIPLNLKSYTLPHTHNYPPLFHFFLSLFGIKYIDVIERYINVFLDLFNVFLVYILSDLLFKNDFQLAIYSTLFYLFSPVLFRTASGPRIFSGTPRVLGQTLFLLHFLFFIACPNDKLVYVIFFILSSLFFSLLIITSKFALQVILFFTPVFIYLDYKYLLIFLSGLLLAMVLFPKLTISLLKLHIKHSIHYALVVQQNLLYPKFYSLKKYFFDLGYHVLRFWKIKKLLKFIWSNNHSLNYLLFIFFYFPLIFIMFFKYDIVGNQSVLFTLTLYSLIVFILTKNKPFLFLGEGERYLEYALPFIIVLFCSQLLKLSNDFFIFSFLIVSIIITLFSVYSAFEYLRKVSDKNQELFSLKTHLGSNNPNVFTIFHYMSKEISYLLNVNVLAYYPGGIDYEKTPKSELEFIYKNGTYVASTNILEVCEKYNIEFVICEKGHLKSYLDNIYERSESFFWNSFFISHQTDNLLVLKKTNR